MQKAKKKKIRIGKKERICTEHKGNSSSGKKNFKMLFQIIFRMQFHVNRFVPVLTKIASTQYVVFQKTATFRR